MSTNAYQVPTVCQALYLCYAQHSQKEGVISHIL